MSDAIDTSAEAVERLARLLGWPHDEAPWRATCEQAAATLRALLAERDRIRAETVAELEQMRADLADAMADRDAARALVSDAFDAGSRISAQGWNGEYPGAVEKTGGYQEAKRKALADLAPPGGA